MFKNYYMQLSKIGILLLTIVCLWSCKSEKSEDLEIETVDLAVVEEQPRYEFGFNLNEYVVKRDTIRKGDTFGIIMERNKIGYPKIFQIVEKAKDTFNIAKLQVGKPYTLLCSQDSLEMAQSFIYQPNKVGFVSTDYSYGWYDNCIF